jgi:hypothetical protein
MGFLSTNATAAVASSGGGGYLNPSKIASGSSVRFALLSDEPLEFWEAWVEDAQGKCKPLRFVSEPTPDDIQAEAGPNYTRRMNRDGNGYEAAKFAIAVPVFNYSAEAVQVMALTQKSIIRELDSISQTEDYSNLLEWDFSIAKEGAQLTTEYKLLPLPRKKGSDAAISEAWSDAQSKGFDIKMLLTGGNPFSGKPAD